MSGSKPGRPHDLAGVVGLAQDLAELHVALDDVSTPEAAALQTVLTALEDGQDAVTAATSCVRVWKETRASPSLSARHQPGAAWEGLSSAVAVLTAGRGEFADVLGDRPAAPTLAAMTSITRGLLSGVWPEDQGRSLLQALGLLALEERSP